MYFSFVLLLMLSRQMLATESIWGESASFPNDLPVTRYHFGIYLPSVTAMETLWNDKLIFATIIEKLKYTHFLVILKLTFILTHKVRKEIGMFQCTIEWYPIFLFQKEQDSEDWKMSVNPQFTNKKPEKKSNRNWKHY